MATFSGQRVQLHPVQTELVLRPAHQQLDRLAPDPATTEPGQHEHAQPRASVRSRDADEPDLADELPARRIVDREPVGRGLLGVVVLSAGSVPRSHSAFSCSGSMPSIAPMVGSSWKALSKHVGVRHGARAAAPRASPTSLAGAPRGTSAGCARSALRVPGLVSRHARTLRALLLSPTRGLRGAAALSAALRDKQ